MILLYISHVVKTSGINRWDRATILLQLTDSVGMLAPNGGLSLSSTDDARIVRAKRLVKVPGNKQFEMDGIELEADELQSFTETRLDAFHRLTEDLDKAANEWKEKYEKERHPTRTAPSQPTGNLQVPLSESPFGPAVPSTSQPQPSFEGDAYPDVKWKSAPYGEFVFANLPAVAQVVQWLDARLKQTKPLEGILNGKINGLDVFGKGISLIIGAHSYKIGSGQTARFLNRTLAKPKEPEKK
jgi:hypothetical protein